MTIFICATEHSADLHAKYLINELKKINPSTKIMGVLGKENESEEIWLHNSNLNVMGFSDVIPKIPKILSYFKFLEKKIESTRPDRIILIDGPDFNLRMAKKLHKFGIPIFYYICPTVWAWRKGRAKILQKYCDRVVPILPFESEILRKLGCQSTFLGHPILDEINFSRKSKQDFLKEYNLPLDLLSKKWIGIFPGSRTSEIERHLSTLLKFMDRLSDDYLGLVASIKPLGIKHTKIVEVPHVGEKLFSVVDKALVKSGTSTLQAAIYGVPSIVFYKVSLLNEIIFKTFINYEGFVSLPNLILGRELFPELLQEEFNLKNLLEHFQKLPEQIENERRQIVEKLGGPGCSQKLARMIYDFSKT